MSSYEENLKKVQTILERGIGILAQNYAVRKLDAGEFESMVTAGTPFRIAHFKLPRPVEIVDFDENQNSLF